MVRYGVAALCAAIVVVSSSASARDVVPVMFPAYETVPKLDNYASVDTYRAAVADTRFVMEQLTYDSDGLKVHAYLYRPATPSGRSPVVVFNRGSHTWPAFSAELVAMANRLASAGYVVVAPMYRGSGGAPGRDELGGADLGDLFALLPVIRALPYANPDELYLYGESRGGMMVYQALRDGFPAKAAAVVGAFSDLDRMLADSRWQQAGASIWPDLPTNREAIVARRSAVRWPEKLTVPILMLHGAKDRAVDPGHSFALAQKLAALGADYELHVVAGGDHTLSRRASDRDRWVVDWFRAHAKTLPTTKPAPTGE